MPHYADYEYHEVVGSRTRPYAAFGPFRLVTIAMMAITVVLLCLCVACGLMYVADLAEEYPTSARSVLRTLILVNLVVHGLILVVDQLSWWRSMLSIVLNLLYIQLMRGFPFIRSLNDPLVCATVLLVLLESAMWYWFSLRIMYFTSFFAVISFFVFLWLVPLGLLSSCVLEEERLPGAAGGGGSFNPWDGGRGERRGAAAVGSGGGGPKRKTVLNRFVEFLKPPQG